MKKAYITKIDNNYIRVDFDDIEDIKKMMNHFSYEVENSRYSEKYKNGEWDGKYKFYNFKKRTIYYGLIKDVYLYLKNNGYTIDLDQNVLYNEESISTDDINFAVDKGYKLRDYQEKAVFDCLRKRRRMIQSPTGSGKTLITYSLVEYLRRKNKKILIVVPRVQLVIQTLKEFIDYGGDTVKYHGIYQGRSKESEAPVIISTRDSLRGYTKNNKKYFKQFDVVIVDEGHGANATTITNIAKLCTNAEYRFALSGSFYKSELEIMKLKGLFGPLNIVIRTKELIDNGTLAQLDIKVLNLRYTDEDVNFISTLSYQDETYFIETHKARNELISRVCLSRKGNVLCLYRKIAHGKVFEKLSKQYNDDGTKKIFLLSGKDKVKIRDEVVSIMEQNNNCVVFATYGIFSTGINIKNIEHVIMGSPMKSAITVAQSIGRGLRKSAVKTDVMLYDIVDNMARYNPTVDSYINNYSVDHGGHRIALYDEEKFNDQIINRNIGESYEFVE